MKKQAKPKAQLITLENIGRSHLDKLGKKQIAEYIKAAPESIVISLYGSDEVLQFLGQPPFDIYEAFDFVKF
jgi:hypothetical protein